MVTHVSEARPSELVGGSDLGTSGDVLVRRSRPETSTDVGLPTPGQSAAARTLRYVRTQIVFDAAAALLASLVALAVHPVHEASPAQVVLGVLGAAVAWPLAIALCQGYDRRRAGFGDHEPRAVGHAAVLAMAAGAVPSAILDQYGVVALSVVAVPSAAVLSIVSRALARHRLHVQQQQGRYLRRVVLVGTDDAVGELTDVLAREQRHGMLVVGACVPEGAVGASTTGGTPVVGDLADVRGAVRRTSADAVAVAGGSLAGGSLAGQGYLRSLSWSLEGAGVELLVNPGLVEVAGPRMHIRPHVGLPLLHVEQPHFTGWRRIVKRVVDVALSAVALVVASPLLVAAAVAIKVEDGGPVFFRQVRVGLDGARFSMWKFRSMHTDAEARLADLRRADPSMGLMFKMTNDPRITAIGKVLRRFSIDELPQLFNVLGGKMSLVGPRPPLESEVASYQAHAHRRLLVTPGLTGLWQVSGRSLLTWEETVRLDLRYVENWTLSLDLLIMWKTVRAVLAQRGAF